MQAGVRPPAAIDLGGCQLAESHPPVVVAEMSGNHNGDLARALEIVDAVADSGAQALKVQTYRADTITIDVDTPAFRVSGSHELWGGRSLYDLYSEAHMPWEWHAPVFDRARDRGLIPFSSPFDPTAVALLEDLDVSLYKIASLEIVDLPLIRCVAETGKPVVISTGAASLGEIDAAVRAVRETGNEDVVVLGCTSSYPASPSETNLRALPLLRDTFGCVVGLSDHTLGIGVAVAAIAFGASMVEKHVTLSRTAAGVDSSFSLEPAELAALVLESGRAWQALGHGGIGPQPSEAESLRLRRSLFVVADVRSGALVTTDNVRSIRPTGGLAPDEITTVLGRTFVRDAARGTPLTWDLL